MSKMFFIFLACVMVLGIGVSSYGNELSPAANDSAESINRSITSLNYDTRNENINFKMQNGTAYTSN
ncbi:hypothetical protein BAG01nite_45980 [Brevibacillus agri]|jgi:hypothetical protein|uniref:Uncharacterized protein n=2 Tax=Brevibacillus TaxID=55080 RepID=A0A3M8A9K9_9BACL|nr:MULTISPECIES: hypothetical protein [Brevibacillus]ELK41571.1 hypothetical protein D478_13123 [Brevibacillus agri BAB-2500]TGV31201.1 hypothetical protein EN829_033865 [Mesorhizobium sp. M00.F.Ca.ET.186.01.1.1]EJL39953.1 hypothetical protein PMI08_04680 [Brevibacillus sp. CF112]KZE53552.1 hypothetical protein AV540_07995 [Brevibacillus parabrevis]MBG9566524.1 hypothetical protein [Brevibacillus agri]